MEGHSDTELRLTQYIHANKYFVLFKLTRQYCPCAKFKRKANKRGTSEKHDCYTIDLRTLIPIMLKNSEKL